MLGVGIFVTFTYRPSLPVNWRTNFANYTELKFLKLPSFDIIMIIVNLVFKKCILF